MRHVLAPHVHMASLGDDVVVLDVEASTYQCVPGGRIALQPATDGSVSPIAEGIVRSLRSAGLLAEVDSFRRMPPPPLPTRDVPDMPGDRASIRECGRLLLCLWDLAIRYRGRSLARIIAFVDAEARRTTVEADNEAEILRLSAIFQRAAAWLPISRKCLVRSFVLLRFLQRSGLRARWVYGVRTWPFGAHCWLQHAETALDDAAERLVVYEPILAAG